MFRYILWPLGLTSNTISTADFSFACLMRRSRTYGRLSPIGSPITLWARMSVSLRDRPLLNESDAWKLFEFFIALTIVSVTNLFFGEHVVDVI